MAQKRESSFIWWVICQLWSPVVPGIVGLLTALYVLVKLSQTLGTDRGWAMAVECVSFFLTLPLSGLAIAFAQIGILKLIKRPDLFEDVYKVEDVSDPWFDDPNVG